MNGTSYNVVSGPAGDNMKVTVDGKEYNVSFGKTGTAEVSASKPVTEQVVVSGGEDVIAPVAGTLLRFAVENGSSVTKGQTVVILESMKMELEVKSPCDGVINFTATAGSQVSNGQKLASVGGVAKSSVANAKAPAAKKETSTASVATVSGSGTPVKAPVAGTLLRYAVSEGTSVSADTTVVVVESMKMELEIKAGSAGKIHFTADVGSQISNGQTVAEVL